MFDNVISFGRVGSSEPALSDEDQARVNAVRRELQDMIFDDYEAEKIEHNNPAQGKMLSPMSHLYSMLLSDAAVLEAINSTDLEAEGLETELQKVCFAQLAMMEKAVLIHNKVFETNYQDWKMSIKETIK